MGKKRYKPRSGDEQPLNLPPESNSERLRRTVDFLRQFNSKPVDAPTRISQPKDPQPETPQEKFINGVQVFDPAIDTNPTLLLTPAFERAGGSKYLGENIYFPHLVDGALQDCQIIARKDLRRHEWRISRYFRKNASIVDHRWREQSITLPESRTSELITGMKQWTAHALKNAGLSITEDTVRVGPEARLVTEKISLNFRPDQTAALPKPPER